METSVLQLHCTTHISFVSIALTKLSLISLFCEAHALWRGDFPQSLTLSAALLLPPTLGAFDNLLKTSYLTCMDYLLVNRLVVALNSRSGLDLLGLASLGNSCFAVIVVVQD